MMSEDAKFARVLSGLIKRFAVEAMTRPPDCNPFATRVREADSEQRRRGCRLGNLGGPGQADEAPATCAATSPGRALALDQRTDDGGPR